jgi:predicted transport protein
LKLEPTQIPNGSENYRDVTNIGHYGTGNVELTLSSLSEFEPVKEFLQSAYNKVGG